MSTTTDTRQVRLIQPQSAEAVIAHYYEKSWGMVIGINDYQGEHPTLANARNDAIAFADLLRVNYKFDEVFTFYDQEATCDTNTSRPKWCRRLPTIGRCGVRRRVA